MLFLKANTGSEEDAKMGKFMAAAHDAGNLGIDCPNDGYENHLQKSGGGQPHNNMTLSVAAYVWKRTALPPMNWPVTVILTGPIRLKKGRCKTVVLGLSMPVQSAKHKE